MNLDGIKTCAQIALALAGAFAFGAMGFVVLEARPVVRHLDGVVQRGEAVESKIFATSQNLDAETRVWAAASKDQAKAVQDLAGDLHRTTLQAQGAIADTRKLLGTANTQLGELGPLLASARKATDSIPPAVAAIQGAADDLNEPIDQGNSALKHVDAMLTAPDLVDTLHSIKAATASGAHISAEADKKFTALVDPPPCTGKWCWAKKTYGIAIGAGKLAEPAYWLEQLIESIH